MDQKKKEFEKKKAELRKRSEFCNSSKLSSGEDRYELLKFLKKNSGSHNFEDIEEFSEVIMQNLEIKERNLVFRRKEKAFREENLLNNKINLPQLIINS